MIHAKQWHYSLHRDFQQLHSIHSTRRSPRDSSSTNSTFRRQRALRVTLHAEGKEIFYPVYKDLQGIPILQGHYYTFQHLPVQSSTFQCYPVYPVYPGIPPIPAFLQLECNSTHWLVSTRNSIEYQSNTRQTTNFHSSKKGRCCDISQTLRWHDILQNRITGQDDI